MKSAFFISFIEVILSVCEKNIGADSVRIRSDVLNKRLLFCNGRGAGTAVPGNRTAERLRHKANRQIGS